MNRFRFCVATVMLAWCVSSAFAMDDHLFRATDPLAARDEWGLLTQGPLNPNDFEYRYPSRVLYYLQSGRELSADPAYVGALQDRLRRKGYYIGPIDGVFSDEVSDAIARLQKAHAMRVNGRLTIPVRRVLYLP